jgi:hypothetical protein
MSLLSSASVWTNDDSNSNKKRTATMRKTIKKLPDSNSTAIGNHGEYVSSEENYQKGELTNTIESNVLVQEERHGRVNDLLNKITSVNNDNAGSKLATFNPIANPSINSRRAEVEELPPPPNAEANDNLYNPLQIAPPVFNTNAGDSQKSQYSTYSNTLEQDLGNYGNYKHSYTPPKAIVNSSYYGKMGLGQGGSIDNKILDKINYLIHMMEEQKSEKTGNVLEEVVLYTFLGVFVIFIVDSFSRAGKYIR